MKTKLVRIYPLDPRRGHHVERYSLSGSGYPMFVVTKGWYEVDKETASTLGKIRNNDNDQMSPHVFQVLDQTQAKAVEATEKTKAAEAAAPIPVPARKIKKQASNQEGQKKKTRKQPKD